MNVKQIAGLIKHCRKESHLSQQALAQLAGIGKTVVFDIEKGKETVQLNNLLRILDILNIRIELHPPLTIETADEKSTRSGS